MTVQGTSTYARVVTAGMPFWRLEISNWGNRQTNADANSLEYVDAPVNGGGQVIVIGPDSTVDTVIVAYQDLSLTPQVLAKLNNDIATASPGFINLIMESVSVVRPGVLLPGPLRIRAAEPSMYADTYYRDGSSTTSPFGGGEVLFERPQLQLYVYPSLPALFIPHRRVDMLRSVQTTASADVGAETLIGIWPVAGRKRKAVYFRVTDTLEASLRVGLISGYVGGTAGVPLPRMVEDTLSTAALTATTQASMSSEVPCQYLAAYYTRTAGAGDVITNLIASDE